MSVRLSTRSYFRTHVVSFALIAAACQLVRFSHKLANIFHLCAYRNNRHSKPFGNNALSLLPGIPLPTLITYTCIHIFPFPGQKKIYASKDHLSLWETEKKISSSFNINDNDSSGTEKHWMLFKPLLKILSFKS